MKLEHNQKNSIENARRIAKKAHMGQKRWDGSDYFENHIEKVVENLYEMRFSLPEQFQMQHLFECLVCAAYLHDVVEDSNVSIEDLEKDFSVYVIDILKDVTKNKGETYFDFIMRIHGSSCYGSRIVKIADLKSNMKDTIDKTTNKYSLYEFALYILTYFQKDLGK